MSRQVDQSGEVGLHGLPFTSGRSHAFVPYAAAIMAVAAAVAARAALSPLLGPRAVFLIFVAPVLFSMLIGGRRPAFVAGGLSLTAGLVLSLANSANYLASAVEGLMFVLVCWGIGAMGTGIARQRRAAQAEALRATAAGEELRLLLEGASDYAITMLDPDGRVTTWNGGAERIFGWRAAEIVGHSFSQFYPREDANIGQPALDLEAAAAEGRVRGEMWRVRKDGSEFLADLTLTPLLREEGTVRGFAQVVQDVTERRAAERALERRENHLQSILATVPDAMVVIDEHGLIISFSAAAEWLFGYGEGEVVGKNVSMLMPSPDRNRHDDYIRHYLQTGTPRIIGTGRIVTGLRADGSTFPMKLSVGEALTGQQRLFTGFIQDLTERKEFEAQLEQMKSELIHVSRLSAMGTMASTLAHELNQPLTAIATYGEAAETILQTDGKEDRDLLREIFSDLTQQSLRAGSIVRRLRDFVSRGETAKSVEDLPRLINEASALALVGGRERGINAQFFYHPDATPVLVDRVQIQQVLINLMRNAMEAMEGCAERRLTVRTSLADPETVQISISDTGSGIAPDVHEHLFEAFATTKANGMGLGLSICRTIVEAHGGRIRANSERGKGTEFLFTLLRASAGETL